MLALLSFVGAKTASADSYYPLLTVSADAHSLNAADDLTFNLEYLSSAGQAGKVTIQTPRGFNASLVQAVGTNLGAAGLGVLPAGTNISAAPSAPITVFKGSLVVADPNAFAADPVAQACAPGHHTAIWSLSLENVRDGSLALPVAVDASRGGYKLTICLEAVQAASKEGEYLYFTPNEIFRNPAQHGLYLFDGVVTPFSDTDAATTPSSYEIRAYETLPQVLTATPNYDPATKTLTVTGKAVADNRLVKGASVELYAANSADAINWKDLGSAVTGADGSYSFSTKLNSLHYTYLYANIEGGNQPACPGTSSQPAGCASTSADGGSSVLEKITSGS